MNKLPDRQVVITNDGSCSLFVPVWDEYYHSVHGAVQESEHIFINAGLKYFYEKCSKREITIYEVGFGTGLNAYLTLLFAQKQGVKINYQAIEAFPLRMDEVHLLNYVSDANTDEKEFFDQLHSSEWNKTIEITPYFQLTKHHEFLENRTQVKNVDIVYFDAFAPSAQPELWTEEIFKDLYENMSPNGILVTYCAKGAVKRAMKSAQWSIEKLQGPPGKREMTRAYIPL